MQNSEPAALPQRASASTDLLGPSTPLSPGSAALEKGREGCVDTSCGCSVILCLILEALACRIEFILLGTNAPHRSPAGDEEDD